MLHFDEIHFISLPILSLSGLRWSQHRNLPPTSHDIGLHRGDNRKCSWHRSPCDWGSCWPSRFADRHQCCALIRAPYPTAFRDWPYLLGYRASTITRNTATGCCGILSTSDLRTAFTRIPRLQGGQRPYEYLCARS